MRQSVVSGFTTRALRAFQCSATAHKPTAHQPTGWHQHSSSRPSFQKPADNSRGGQCPVYIRSMAQYNPIFLGFTSDGTTAVYPPLLPGLGGLQVSIPSFVSTLEMVPRQAQLRHGADIVQSRVVPIWSSWCVMCTYLQIPDLLCL